MIAVEVVRGVIWVFFKIVALLYIPFRTFKMLTNAACCPPIENELLLLSARELAAKIRNRELSSESIVKAYISRIREVNSIINAVIDDRFDKALEDAKQVDLMLSTSGLTSEQIQEKYPLLGVPLTVKGSISVKGLSYCAGLVSRKLKADNDATVVERAKEAGAIVLLISNVPELCLNWETTNNVVGTTKNPYNSKHTVGGSSGGETSLLASAGSVIGIGSDIAGSLRLPAHFCGVWGHKPSPGLVSHEGHYPSCSDEYRWEEAFTLGPLARHASDLKLLLEVIANKDNFKPIFSKSIDIRKIRIFYLETFDSSLMNKARTDVIRSLRKTIAHFDENCNNKCTKINHPLFKYAAEISFIKLLSIDNVDNLFEGKGEGCYTELLKYIIGMSDCKITSIGYGVMRRWMDAIPNRVIKGAHKMLEELKQFLLENLKDDGVLILPTFYRDAGYHGDVLKDIFNYGYCSIFNALGFPVTNCPISFSKNNLPIGLQVAAAPNCDHLTLAIANEIEQAFGGWKNSRICKVAEA